MRNFSYLAIVIHLTAIGVIAFAASDNARGQTTGYQGRTGLPRADNPWYLPPNGSSNLIAGSTGPARLTPEELINISVYEKANRGVVNITTTTVSRDNFMLMPVPGKGTGSGAILDKQGHVLTNNHVLEDALNAEVTLFNNNSYAAKLVGKDPANDVAVLKIEVPASTLYPILPGDSSTLKVGQRIYAIGNPFGLETHLDRGHHFEPAAFNPLAWS